MENRTIGRKTIGIILTLTLFLAAFAGLIAPDGWTEANTSIETSAGLPGESLSIGVSDNVAFYSDLADALARDIQELKEKAGEDGRVTVVIKLQETPLQDVKQEDVVEELKAQTEQSQKTVMGLLDRKDVVVLNTFWLTNAVLAEVPVDILDELASLPEVERIFENFEITIPEPQEEETLPQGLSVGYTWGLEKIHAPQVWDTLGVTGSGVRVAVLDTGVDISHPDIAGKMWTDNPADPAYPGGWIEFDDNGNIVPGSTPYDSAGHGTHCLGTVAGGASSGTAIGVAPGATLMHGLVIPGGSGYFAQVIAGMQWVIAPVDQYGVPAGEPADVVSMSLGAGGYYDEMIEPVQNIKAAGIVLCAAIGNEGEGASGSPGNVYDAIAIGATDINDYDAYFSSGEVIEWPASHPDPYIKPDLSAPGVGVYSSVPGGGYDTWNGTSMATPHAAGTVALMLESNPDLTVDEIYEILKNTAVDLGDQGQDIRYGWGRIDALEAVYMAGLDSGIEGIVTDADSGGPLEGAQITVSETGQAKYTNASGYYRFFLPPGNYNLTTSLFSYYQDTAAVAVAEDVFTSQNFDLNPMPTGFIGGVVTDAYTGVPIEGATVSLTDTPLSVTTDGTGGYNVEAPIGTYDVSARGTCYRESAVPAIVVSDGATSTVNFALDSSRLVQLTDYQGWDNSPSVTQTGDGTVWAVWESDRPGDSHLWYRASPDAGYTWTAEALIDTGYYWSYDPDVIQDSISGDLCLVWYDWRSGNADIWFMTSTDMGATWTPATQLTSDTEIDYGPSIIQDGSGRIWVTWYSYRTGNADIWYKTSTDGGATWSPDMQLTTDADYDMSPSVARDYYDGKIWIVWNSYRSSSGIWCANSADGGVTWTPDYPADIGDHWGYAPEIASTSDGVLWLTWQSYDSGNSDIWYQTSADGGVSGSAPRQFTRFAGNDFQPATAGLSDGGLAIVWGSNRFANDDVWYGVAERSEDCNPPPYLNWVENDPEGPWAGQVVTVRASVFDEAGINDVQLLWWHEGIPQSGLTMYDDGSHEDYGANDDVYGVQIGPFPLIGTVIEYQIQMTDTGGNTVIAPQTPHRFEVQEPFVRTADILLVADNPYDGDSYIHYYTDAIENAGYDCDVWNSEDRGHIPGDVLNQYLDGVVIWSTPDWGYIGYSDTVDNLGWYLDNGGKLFISGQNIGNSIGYSWFYYNYLHAVYIQDDIGLYGLYNVLPVTDPRHLSIRGGYGADNQYSPDEIDPVSPAEVLYLYDPTAMLGISARLQQDEAARAAQCNVSYMRGFEDISREAMMMPTEKGIGATGAISGGSGGVRVDMGTYKVVYFAFGFEAINSAADRAAVMDSVLRWLNGVGQALVYVSPSSQREGQGYTFDVDIMVDPIVDISGVEIALSFNASLLQADTVTEGNLLNQGGSGTFFFPGTIDNNAGTITGVAGAITQQGGTVSNIGTFATISFTTRTTAGTSPLDLSDVVVGDMNGDPLSVTVNNGDIRITQRWDVNGDGTLNVLDMVRVGQHWGQTGAGGWITEDVNQDGVINVLDMVIIGQHWGQQD